MKPTHIQSVLSLDQARCPRDGTKIGKVFFETVQGRGAFFTVECEGRRHWDNKTNEHVHYHRHLWEVRVTLGYIPQGKRETN